MGRPALPILWHAIQVPFDRSGRYGQLLGDLASGIALRDEPNDLPLAIRERRDALRVSNVGFGLHFETPSVLRLLLRINRWQNAAWIRGAQEAFSSRSDGCTVLVTVIPGICTIFF